MDLQEALSDLHQRIGECYEITRSVVEERVSKMPSSCSSIPQRDGSLRPKLPSKPKSGPSLYIRSIRAIHIEIIISLLRTLCTKIGTDAYYVYLQGTYHVYHRTMQYGMCFGCRVDRRQIL